MTNLEWVLSLSVKDMEKRFYREECTNCIYDNSGECGKRSCVEGKLKWLNQERVSEIIKPCANCGGEAKFVADPMRINPEIGCVQCCDCHIRTSVGTKYDVIKAWNRRTEI